MKAESEAPLGRLGPAPWKECSDAEKIERLRNEIDGWRRLVSELRDRVTLMESHQHAANGAVVVDLQQADRIHRQFQMAGSFNYL